MFSSEMSQANQTPPVVAEVLPTRQPNYDIFPQDNLLMPKVVDDGLSFSRLNLLMGRVDELKAARDKAAREAAEREAAQNRAAHMSNIDLLACPVANDQLESILLRLRGTPAMTETVEGDKVVVTVGDVEHYGLIGAISRVQRPIASATPQPSINGAKTARTEKILSGSEVPQEAATATSATLHARTAEFPIVPAAASTALRLDHQPQETLPPAQEELPPIAAKANPDTATDLVGRHRATPNQKRKPRRLAIAAIVVGSILLAGAGATSYEPTREFIHEWADRIF